MFTLGSKTFLGTAGVALIAAIVYSANTTDEAGVLLLMTSVFAAVGIALAILIGAGATDRHSYVGNETSSTGRNPGPTIVPFVVALSAGAVALGFALGPAGFVVGGLGIALALMVWFAQSWHDHPNWVPALTKRVSDGVSLPFGMPITLLAVIGAIGVGVSRTLLAVTPTQSWIVAGIVAVSIFGGAIVLATRERLSKNTVFAAVAVAAVAVLGLAIYGLARGPRPVKEEKGKESASAFAASALT